METSENYIEIDDALKRVGGNMALYKKLLVKFIDGNYIEAIDAALLSGDMEESARQVHTLKGVSANLSLERVRALCVELETKIRGGENCMPGFADLKEAYSVTIDKINELG